MSIPTNDAAGVVPAQVQPVGIEQCQRRLRELGSAYPRTCAVCGLGPCKYYSTKEKAPAAEVPGKAWVQGDAPGLPASLPAEAQCAEIGCTDLYTELQRIADALQEQLRQLSPNISVQVEFASAVFHCYTVSFVARLRNGGVAANREAYTTREYAAMRCSAVGARKLLERRLKEQAAQLFRLLIDGAPQVEP